ncbi:CPBP family intramembrane glutamic endopeptidase [Ruminococcus albus]|uniref:Abortive infection protein n=1 Tax=Ruminococcus albus (strain ATCC 27210 / DSM 20455 / JCM 14654 / NCDO 2250 / 7) TaxID=697329 RepID=E6UFH1_RUMA7|nr:type II CAAX endopeptidase family protein [Ruminococcus albus]ADU21875.1 Abortive infection protein [Ruminococcus albus 7 = DSM 20455]
MTSNEKKLTLKRIAIFIMLCYIPNYVLEIVFSDHNGGMTSAAAGLTIMLYPAIANILTRIITKEGKGEHYLKAHFKKHKGIYIAAAVSPLIMGIINLLVCHFVLDSQTDMGDMLNQNLYGSGLRTLIPLILLSYMVCIPFIVMGFGEEFGWRAYLTPKLEKFMPRFPACCITGVIWAVWHAPLIWYGYDFGRDYPGFPYVGVIAMCAVCIPLSYVLTWMTEKTKSVYPAAICHMVIDNVMNIPALTMISEKTIKDNSLLFGILALGLVPAAATIGIMIAEKIKSEKAA